MSLSIRGCFSSQKSWFSGSSVCSNVFANYCRFRSSYLNLNGRCRIKRDSTTDLWESSVYTQVTERDKNGTLQFVSRPNQENPPREAPSWLDQDWWTPRLFRGQPPWLRGTGLQMLELRLQVYTEFQQKRLGMDIMARLNSVWDPILSCNLRIANPSRMSWSLRNMFY